VNIGLLCGNGRNARGRVKRDIRYNHTVVWAISIFAHILTYMEGRSRLSWRRSPRGDKINILNKKIFSAFSRF